jgi:predicted lipoprotein with Yx(FWY)xxD motif
VAAALLASGPLVFRAQRTTLRAERLGLLAGAFVATALLAGSPGAVAADHPIDSYLSVWRSGRFTAGHMTEGYIHVAMPPGFRVVNSELDGPVFADASGKTLYIWPREELRNGSAGDNRGESECTGVRLTVNDGFMSPYPAGLLLPDLDQRPSCTQAWPPALAPAHPAPLDGWSIIERSDGMAQWAYEGFALYTSFHDRRLGDVLGGTSRRGHGDSFVARRPAGPPPDVPPGFRVVSTALGRLLVTEHGQSVYVSDQDSPNRSHCDAACTQTWIPIVAPNIARPHGEWSIIERTSGVHQWAFRSSPLYRYVMDSDHPYSLRGSDAPGWHNVFTQMTPPPPRDFTVQDTTAGQVLADSAGMTIYIYQCGEDSLDQLGCDYPTETQAYRWAMCGGGDPRRCLQSFPYVLAPADAPRGDPAWSAVDIEPMTGRLAQSGQSGALHVWAYRGRPIYTFSGDRVPGDINGDSHGEFRAERQGFKAFWLRDDYFEYAD